MDKSHIVKMQEFYENNLSDIEATKIFEEKLISEKNYLRGKGFSITFEQDIQKATGMSAPNKLLVTTCRLKNGSMLNEGSAFGHDSHSKYKALIEAIKNTVKN
jgi:hypothetical protein